MNSARRSTSFAAQLLSIPAALARFGPHMARLARRADPNLAMTFSPAWWQAVPPPDGYAHRLLLLHQHGELCAAMCLRERHLAGLPSGILHGSDAKGEGLILCPPAEVPFWLAAAITALFRVPRCTALLLDRPAGQRCLPALAADSTPLRLQENTQPTPLFWRTTLCACFEDTLAPFGHRTRRNLRHALRRAAQQQWQFLPELSPAQVSAATTALATTSTHPYTSSAIAARLELERSQQHSFSVGLRSATGAWLSMLSGVRRPGGTSDIFWQANVANTHDSVALTMRALVMQHEGQRGTHTLRFIGGTSHLLEHCCIADPGAQTLIWRPGLRPALLRHVLHTPLASPENPLRQLLC